MAKITKRAQDLADKLTVTRRPDSSTIEVDGYSANLPEGITMDTVNKLQVYDSDFVIAATKRFGEEAVEMYKSEPNTDTIRTTIGMGEHKTLSHIYEPVRTTESSGETTHQFGSTSVSVTTRSYETTGFKSIINEITAKTEQAYKAMNSKTEKML